MIFYEDIFKAFQKQKVKYIVVGGVAVNLLSVFRTTMDLDILVEMSDINLKKIVTILKRKGYKVKQPVDPMGIADEKTRKDWIHNKHMKAFNFYKYDELKEVDILIDSPVTYETARKKAKIIKSGLYSIPVVSIDHLIKMKQKSGRDQDKIDIINLKKAKKMKDN